MPFFPAGMSISSGSFPESSTHDRQHSGDDTTELVTGRKLGWCECRVTVSERSRDPKPSGRILSIDSSGVQSGRQTELSPRFRSQSPDGYRDRRHTAGLEHGRLSSRSR